MGRYLELGESALLDHQLLELFLFYGIPRKDTNETAHHLIDGAGSMEAMLYQPIERSMETPGVGQSTALMLNVCGAIAKRSENNAAASYSLVSSFRQMRYLFNFYKGEPKGTAALTLLDEEMNLIETILIRDDKKKKADSIIYTAVSSAKNAGASYAFLSHIHKNGEREPSVEDIYLTASMKRALYLAECTLLEHYIVTDSDVIPVEGLNNKAKRKDIDIK